MADTQTQNRPKPRSFLSHESRRSIRSNGSAVKMDLTESPKDKKRLNFRSDPSRAISEAQPAAVALEDCSIESLRAMTWKDALGNVIDDPDRSNPSRSRMERPLDTIRSFEAAVEGTYTNRRSTFAGPPASHMSPNGNARRNSYMGGLTGNGPMRSTAPPGFSPPGRNHASRPLSFADDHEGRFFSAPARAMRPNSAAFLPNSNGNFNVDPTTTATPPPDSFSPRHTHQASYDTITTATGSYGTDPRGTSTGPSSHNSSVDRFQLKGDETGGDRSHGVNYANGPYSPVSPTYNHEQSFWKSVNGRPRPAYGRTDYLNSPAASKLPETTSSAAAKPDHQPPEPIKLNSGSHTDLAQPSPKRQSWFKRRFSKKA